MLIRRAYWVLAATLGVAFCASPPEAPPERRQEGPLWIGILRRDLHLVPIARYDADRPASAEGEGWHEPWPEMFRLDDLRFDRDRGTPVVSAPLGMVPDADTTASGGSVRHDWSRTTEAPVDWYFHVRGQSVSTLSTAHLSLMRIECFMAWSLPVEETPELEETLRQAALRRDAPVAVTFSRSPDAVVDESELPGLDEIRRELNLVDRPPPGRPPDDKAATYRWLGFHRFGDLLLGVVHERGYEYQTFRIVQIEGDRGRVVADVWAGGC